MPRLMLALLLLFAVAPASATPIQNVTVNVFHIYADGGNDIICEPCGLHAVSYDLSGNYSVDWYGGAGAAHDVYNQAVADGLDIFDATNADYHQWLNDHPTSLIFFDKEDVADVSFLFSSWILGVFDTGELTGRFTDTISLGTGAGDFGQWFTGVDFAGSESLEATFETVRVPEPSSLLLTLSALVFCALRFGSFYVPRTNRHANRT